jgi:hypothetical protein
VTEVFDLIVQSARGEWLDESTDLETLRTMVYEMDKSVESDRFNEVPVEARGLGLLLIFGLSVSGHRN